MSKGIISGYACLFNVPYDMGNHDEMVEPGCFKGAAMNDVCMLKDHSSSLLLGRTGTGTLTLTVDAKGLYFSCTLPETELGEETAHLVGAGILSQCSWGWTGTKDRWSTTKEGRQLRIITSVKRVWDTTVTAWGANPATRVYLEAVNTTAPATFRTPAPQSKPIQAQAPKAPAQKWDAVEDEILWRAWIKSARLEDKTRYENYNKQFQNH